VIQTAAGSRADRVVAVDAAVKKARPVKLTERMVAWRSSELGQWCESRKRGV
jgi:hypothetical protein